MSKTTYEQREFHYTGNSPNGRDITHSDGIAQLLTAIGITPPQPPDDDAPDAPDAEWQAYHDTLADYDRIYDEILSADKQITIAGHRITIQRHRVRQTQRQFGYTTHATYTLHEADEESTR